MSVDTSILTTTAKEATELQVAGFQNAVAAHTGADWAAHTQMRVHALPYSESNGDVVSAYTLRMGTTRDNSGVSEDVALALPVISTGNLAVAQGTAPIFIVPPANATFALGAIAQLSVVVISALAPTFQWYKERANLTAFDPIDGATAATLTLPNANLADSGIYRCVASNDYGSSTSSSCTLTIH